MSWLSELTRAARIGFLLSVCWLIAVIVFSINTADGFRSFDSSTFFSMFLVFGVLPITLGWGIRWIRRSNQAERKAHKPDGIPKQFVAATSNQDKDGDGVGFTWWRVWAWLGLILGNLYIAGLLHQEMGAFVFVLVGINTILMVLILNYSKYAFLIATIISLNPILWIVNGFYLKNRWNHPRLNKRN